MAKAFVSLKEGKSYRYKDYVFTNKPLPVTDPADIKACQDNNLLQVSIEEDKPVTPLKAKPVAPVHRPEDHADDGDIEPLDDDGDEGDADDDDDAPAEPTKPVSAPKPPFKPGNKPAVKPVAKPAVSKPAAPKPPVKKDEG